MEIRWSWAAMALAVALAVGGCTEAGVPERQALQRGFEQYSARQYSASERAAGDYIAKFPQDSQVDEAYYLRGVSRMARRDAGGAAADLNEAIQRTKRDDLKAKAYRALGELAFDGGRFEQAIDYYKAADNLSKAKPDPLVVYRIGASLQALGRWAEARPYFDRVISMRDPALAQRAANRKDLQGYSVQFGAYANAKTAQDQAAALQKAGVNASVVREMGDAQMLYVVRAGVYRTLAEAEYARGQLARRWQGVRVSP